jgi:predicted nucleic acid-binding protein
VSRYFDTSAIVAAYTRQKNTGRSRELLGEAGVAVSRLSEVETVSALARLARDLNVPDTERDAGIAAFLDDYASWYIVEVSPNVTARARELLVRHSLKASDAIQLASALLIDSRSAPRLDAFVVYDRRLAHAARAERLTVMDG